MSEKKTVVVGLSGGVDSSVTAQVLIEQGYQVIGVFMKNWDDTQDRDCPAAQDAMDARMVADRLGIPFYTVNLVQEYWDHVFTYFLEEHRQNRTPNPDILCNKYIKFAAFVDYADQLGADMVATGHYAKVELNPDTQKYELQVPADRNKDQTYFLHLLTQQQLSRTLFPLSELSKSQVRERAMKLRLHNAQKKDSTGICFVGERDHQAFLGKYLVKTPGNIVTESGQILGEHIGLSFYTLGQRKNLHIGGVKGYPDAPWFVLEKRVETNEIVVCQDTDNPKLLTTEITTEPVHWIAGETPDETKLLAQVRYRQKPDACEIEFLENGGLKVQFEVPQRAVTPGQSVVFYDHEMRVCLGGGVIIS